MGQRGKAKAALCACLWIVASPLCAETKFGAEASVTAGGKPEMAPGQDGGEYYLGTMKAKAALGGILGLSVTESMLSLAHTEYPQRQTTATDPLGTVALVKNPLDGTGAKLDLSATASPGMSIESRDAGMLGSLKASAALSAKVGMVTGGAGSSFTRRYYQYEFADDGNPNPIAVLSGFAFLDVECEPGVDLGANFAVLRTAYYEGPSSYHYSNSLSLSWQTTEHVALELGASTSDAQLTPAGDDNNELTLYKRSQTEMYLSATYAL